MLRHEEGEKQKNSKNHAVGHAFGAVIVWSLTIAIFPALIICHILFCLVSEHFLHRVPAEDGAFDTGWHMGDIGKNSCFFELILLFV